MAVPVALPSLVQTRSMQGSSDTDVSEFIVAPKSSPFHSVATMATPVAKVPMTDRKCLEFMAVPRGVELRPSCPGEDDISVFMSP
jgi:hypothetical protein